MAATTTDAPVRTGHVAQTTPYAWPWNGVLDAARTAVLVVGAPGGADTAGSDALGNAGVVVATLRRAGAPGIRVITRQPARTISSRPPAQASGWDEIPTDEIVVSRGVDGFYGGPLESVLRERAVERLILVGLHLETSVHSTMRTANDMGYECLLVVDACEPGDAGLVPQSVSMIEMSGGIFGAVGVTARVVEAYAREEGVRA